MQTVQIPVESKLRTHITASISMTGAPFVSRATLDQMVRLGEIFTAHNIRTLTADGSAYLKPIRR